MIRRDDVIEVLIENLDTKLDCINTSCIVEIKRLHLLLRSIAFLGKKKKSTIKQNTKIRGKTGVPEVGSVDYTL